MKKEYEEIIKNVCRISSWTAAPIEEKQGAIGVACVLAFMQGVDSTLPAMAANIGLSISEIEIAFNRLLINGVFSDRIDTRNDPILLGQCSGVAFGKKRNKYIFPAEERTRNSWATIAGLAGGLTGLREN